MSFREVVTRSIGKVIGWSGVSREKAWTWPATGTIPPGVRFAYSFEILSTSPDLGFGGHLVFVNRFVTGRSISAFNTALVGRRTGTNLEGSTDAVNA